MGREGRGPARGTRGNVPPREPRGLRACCGWTGLRAVASEPAALLTWAVDGRPLGTTQSERPLDWPLAIGAHTISVRDERGRTESSTILVK